jgi:hypothetical protein
MRIAIALISLASIGAAPPSTDARLRQIVAPVSGAQMKQTVVKLVSFGTRHTLSSQTDPKRGIGAALDWTQGQFKSFGLPTERPCDTFTGGRIPTPTRICDMIAIQRGTERPNDVVIITGHIDSRVTDPLNARDDAPGANDDGSGTAAVIEAARVLSKHKFPGTIVYAALSGEEQGLYGGKVLAAYAKAQGWNVVANLNNDIIGNSCGSDGLCNDKVVRVFSEGPRWQGHEQLAKDLRSLGGENDAPSRNISRWLDGLADRLDIGLDVMQVWRNDRFGRGGDHTEFLNAGYPAVRISVAVENYNWQHQDLRTEKGIKYGDTIENMDFPYLEKITKLNVAALATLASTPPPPDISVEGAVSTDTTLKFKIRSPSASYAIRFDPKIGPEPGTADWSVPQVTIYCRRTDARDWSNECAMGTQLVGNGFVTLHGVRVDDWVFGASISQNGFEGPVSSAVPGGAFKPYVAPASEPVK